MSTPPTTTDGVRIEVVVAAAVHDPDDDLPDLNEVVVRELRAELAKLRLAAGLAPEGDPDRHLAPVADLAP